MVGMELVVGNILWVGNPVMVGKGVKVGDHVGSCETDGIKVGGPGMYL